MNSGVPSKKNRREEARERARQAREERENRARRNRLLLQGGIIGGVLAVVLVVVLIVMNSAPAEQSEAGPRNMASDGILFTGVDGEVTAVETAPIPPGGTPTSGPQSDTQLQIVTYVDLTCPACRVFEESNAQVIRELVASGDATFEVHPIAILDRFFMGTRYASRSANAAACVADRAPNSFLDVMDALFANQPPEQGTGLNNDELVDLVRSAGVADTAVDSCIANEAFRPWVESATARATIGDLPNTDGVSLAGTPTVLVNGVRYDGPLADPVAFLAFVNSLAN